jgi:hypothetical protein
LFQGCFINPTKWFRACLGAGRSVRRSIAATQKDLDEGESTSAEIDGASAANRWRVFMKCAEDEQGGGLCDAKSPEIDDEILRTLGEQLRLGAISASS